jgi:EAL domain-containing protein (putative c-di-GMP-specific phosphodiesterase class I)/serine/threonine protein kinase
MTEQPDTLQKGARLNWYEIQSVLGQGGFGVTYSAIDVNLNHPVALKEYLPQGLCRRENDGSLRSLANATARESYELGLEDFLGEARTLAQLRHANVVRVLSVFEANGTAYMAMERELGRGLSELIDNDEVHDEATLLSLLAPVMDGVEYIHANGFIHRDIKPENIVIRPDNTAVLLDFGAARSTRERSGNRRASVISRGFSPFEQYEGATDEHHQGPWTDVYGLGATLYTVVVGKVPADAMTRGTRLLSGHSDPIEAARPREGSVYSASFLRAVNRALAFHIEDRPQSVTAWRQMMPETPLRATVIAGTIQLETAVGAEVSSAAAHRDLSTYTAMVVDDESFARNLTRRVLNSLGITNVTLAENGERALSLLREAQHHPDIILTDLRMPGMDGIELLRHMGEMEVSSGILLMSGANQRILTTTESLARSHQLNIIGALQKPVKQEPLCELLERFEPGNQTQAGVPWVDPLTEEQLIAGIDNDAIHVVYQPKVSVTERRVVGVEALARWKHPERGILGPGTFIPLAESRGHIDRVTEQVFSKAMAQAGQWRADGLDLHVSVNFSVDTLNRYDLPTFVINEAAACGMDTRMVILEVTESRVMRDVRTPLEILTRLNLHGVGLSIDDFGTGHSSLEQIRRIPFTELKIDRAFVSGAATDAAAHAILESSIALAKSLQLHTVAEGVETQADWDIVAKLGCDTVQGYFASRPIEGDAIPEFVDNWKNG